MLFIALLINIIDCGGNGLLQEAVDLYGMHRLHKNEIYLFSRKLREIFNVKKQLFFL